VSSLKVFVATTRTQGVRPNDFAFATDGELVDLASTCDPDCNPDGGCGCARAFTGLDSRKATTTAEIVVRDLTLVQYHNLFHRSLITAGFRDSPDLRHDANHAADEMARIAAAWPVGTVVERRGDHIVIRAATYPPTTER
jgi:hypothetical protein